MSAVRWERLLSRFVVWEGVSVLWGIACGFAFALVFLALERTRKLQQLNAARVTAWGAVAGAAFPAFLSLRPLLDGASVLYFGGIISASALAGAIWARMSLALAQRAPVGTQSQALPLDVAEPIPDRAHAVRDPVR